MIFPVNWTADNLPSCCVCNVTFNKSNGCVKHAAPLLAKPPKYHRDSRFCFNSKDILDLIGLLTPPTNVQNKCYPIKYTPYHVNFKSPKKLNSNGTHLQIANKKLYCLFYDVLMRLNCDFIIN